MTSHAHPNPTDPKSPSHRDDSFTTEFEAVSTHHRSHGTLWMAQLATILIGAILAATAYGYMYSRRIRPEDAAIGQAEWTAITYFQGARINAWRMKEWTEAYPPDSDANGPATIGLWLGNSQMHTVNQRQPDEFVASLYASEALGWPVRTLSLPNASLQDHLVMLHWAMAQRKPDWVVLALCYDDLRENGLRAEFTDVYDDAWVDALAQSGPLGVELATELRALGASKSGDLQGTTQSEKSTQRITEDWIQSHLNGWPAWSDRSQVMARWELDVRHVRNGLLGIDASTKRPDMPNRTERNMRAFDDILAVARSNGIPVIVYIVPLRWDPEPPYFLDKYDAWKQDVRERCAKTGAICLDLDRLVPDENWGSYKEQELDFMHFRNPGHVLLGNAIGETIAGAQRGETPSGR